MKITFELHDQGNGQLAFHVKNEPNGHTDSKDEGSVAAFYASQMLTVVEELTKLLEGETYSLGTGRLQ